MTAIIQSKLPCNTVGFLTNKGVKQDQIKIDKNKVALIYKDIGILVLKPVIDRIDFSFTPNADFLKKFDPSTDLDEYKETIRKSAYHDAMAGQSGLTPIKGVSFKKPPFSNYNTNLEFQPPGKSDRIIIRIGPKKPGHAFIRFDLNPNRISEEGMQAFRALVMEMLMAEVIQFEYEDFLIWSKVHRIDIAVDILGARPHDLKITPMTNNKPAWKKSHVYKSKTGRLETTYPKTKKGKNDTEYVYDRRLKQVELGFEPDFGEFLQSRYECRATDTTFHKLTGLKNRCVRISVDALNIKAFWKLKPPHRLFIRYALDRSLDKALELIPDKQHPPYKKAYASSVHKIWDAKKIWNFWPDTLKQSGLLP